MKRTLTGLVLGLGMIFLAVGVGRGAEEEKPLSPGWLSLDCCVGPVDNAIANGKGAIEKALGINIGGYFDVGYTYSFNRPNNPDYISLRYFDKDHNKVEFNDFHIFIEKPEKDWGVGFRVSGDFGRTGELLREATFWSKNLHKESSAELREAFLTTTIPLGEGIGVKGGLFVTTLGTEIIPNPGAYNDNISRSYLFNFGIPLRHLGVSFSYPILKTLSANAGIVTGWDDPRDNNNTPAFLGGVTYTPTDWITFASNMTAGEEPRFTGPNPREDTARFVISNVLTVKPIDPLALYLEYTYGHQRKASLGGTRGATWQGVAGIASYNWTDRFNTAFRAEFFQDRDGARLSGDLNGVHADQKVYEVTLTGAYKFTKMLIGRAEVRQDWGNHDAFKRRTTSADKDQTTLALQLLYQF